MPFFLKQLGEEEPASAAEVEAPVDAATLEWLYLSLDAPLTYDGWEQLFLSVSEQA